MTPLRLYQVGELSLLEQIRKKFRIASHDIIVGIGDDAALLKAQHKDLLITTDMMVEGIHFNLNFITPFQLGFKLVCVNVSDIYGMGGKPRFLLLGIAVNKNTEKKFIDSFFDGIQAAIRLYGVSLIGGDLSSTNRGLTLSATLLGYAERYIKRSGAKVGNKIYVTGPLGESACGLELLKKLKRPVPLQLIGERQSAKGRELLTKSIPTQVKHRAKSKDTKHYAISSILLKLGLSWAEVEPLLRRHLMPEIKNPKRFLPYATSMIDISDGLLIDLSRLCDESKVGAKIYRESIPLSPELKKAASRLGISPVSLALSGGEDYELLFTAPTEKKIRAFYIGDITKMERVIIDSSGHKKYFSPEGYQHFSVQR